MNSKLRRKGLALFEQATGLMREHYGSLSPTRLQAFDEKYKGTHISITVSHTPAKHTPTQSIERAIPKLFEHLESHPTGFWGSVFEYRHDPTKEAIEKWQRARALLESVDMLADLWVARSPNTDEPPRFISGGGGLVMPLDTDVLSKKLTKKYKVDCPIELVLTVRKGDSAHLGEQETLKGIASAGLETSPYRRIWLHEHIMGRVTLLAGCP